MFQSQRYIIKTESVFSVIREINEILSLTNEPDKLVNTALDTLSQILNIECCWIQTISDRKLQKLSLAADRGFSDAMKSEITSMDLLHDFTGQIIGMGHKITIPDLNNDGLYGLDSFRAAGYRWLVAVPLMTYRAYGLLGTASKNKRLLDKDTTELIMVIGGLIANALSKAHFTGISAPRAKLPALARLKSDIIAPLPETNTSTAPDTPAAKAKPQNAPITPPVNSPPSPLPEESLDIVVEKKPHVAKSPLPKPLKPTDPAFHSHTRKMETFRKAHG